MAQRIIQQFTVLDDTVFKPLKFVKVEGIQECFPPRVIISYPDTEENSRLVQECYSQYQENDAGMKAWRNNFSK